MKAIDLMTRDHLWACGDTTDCREVARMMAEHDVGAVPVLDNEGRLEGIVTDRDICCRVVASGLSFETPIREIMSREPCTIYPDTDLKEIERLMREYKVRRLPVVDADHRLQGFVSQADLLREVPHGWRKDRDLVKTLETISSP